MSRHREDTHPRRSDRDLVPEFEQPRTRAEPRTIPIRIDDRSPAVISDRHRGSSDIHDTPYEDRDRGYEAVSGPRLNSAQTPTSRHMTLASSVPSTTPISRSGRRMSFREEGLTRRLDGTIFPSRETTAVRHIATEPHNNISSATQQTSRSQSVLTALQQHFVQLSPTSNRRDWDRFTDRHSNLFAEPEDADLYFTEAVIALQNRDPARTGLCVEKAVFLDLLGGRSQKYQDKFFDDYRDEDTAACEKYRERFQDYSRRCRDEVAATRRPATTQLGSTPQPPASMPLGPSPTVNPSDQKGRHDTLHNPNQDLNSYSQSPPSSNQRPNTMSRPTLAQPTMQRLDPARHERSVQQHGGPPITIKDPASTNLKPSIKGNSKNAESETLDARYIRRDPKRAGAFFKRGRVFAILEHSEHGNPNDDDTGTEAKWITKKMGLTVFSHIRRYVVVREGHGYCWAVPINTYGGHGVGKRGLNEANIQAHAIIYTSERPPPQLRSEPTMNKTPIAVDQGGDADPLSPASRVNFQKVTTIEHNVRARSFGRVRDSSMAHFESYWRQHLMA